MSIDSGQGKGRLCRRRIYPVLQAVECRRDVMRKAIRSRPLPFPMDANSANICGFAACIFESDDGRKSWEDYHVPDPTAPVPVPSEHPGFAAVAVWSVS